ncbi:MAG: RibD family protein [Solirubrobacteraceae bacterium]
MTAPATFQRLLPPGPPATAAQLAAELELRALAPEDRPLVAVNMIASLDGRITVGGRARGLGNRADYELFHALRGAADAVLVGAGTVRAESYGPMEQLCVIVSSSLDLSPELGVLRAPGNRVLVVTTSEGELAPCAAQVGYLRTGDIGEALARLRAEHGVAAVVCEGGAHLNGVLLPSGLVDELHLVHSPMVVGGADPLTVVAGGLLDPPLEAQLVSLTESGGWLFTRYRLA